MTAPTPGVWQVSGVRQSILAGEKYIVVGPEKGWVAAIPYSDITVNAHLQAYADARILAAAKDLFEALKMAMPFLEVAQSEVNYEVKPLTAARDAIAKVKGHGGE